MPRPDRGCCCDNSKSPNNSFCCQMDQHTDGRQTFPGCANSYTVNWSNVQLFGRCGCYKQRFGFALRSGSVQVFKQANGTYKPANEVAGTNSCQGYTSAIQGSRILKTDDGCDPTSNCQADCRYKPGICDFDDTVPCDCTAARQCYCSQGGGMDIKAGALQMGCTRVNPNGSFGCTGKIFDIEIIFRTRILLKQTYNVADLPSQTCSPANATPCFSGQGWSGGGCFCQMPSGQPTASETPCFCRFCGGNTGCVTSSIMPSSYSVTFSTGVLATNACPNGQTYSMTDFKCGFSHATGSLTVT